MNPHVTIIRMPGGAFPDPPDRRSAQLLERAGLVSDTSLGVHRIRRDTSASSATRQLRDAERALIGAGYAVTRGYSPAERAEPRSLPPWIQPGPPRTRGRASMSGEDITADVCNGHMEIAFRWSGSDSREILAGYRDGGAAVLYSEDGSQRWGAAHFPSMAEAERAFAHPRTIRFDTSPRAHAARAHDVGAATGPPAARPITAPDSAAPRHGQQRHRR